MKAMVIDTSSTAASVAVFEDGQVLGSFFTNTKQTHSQKLMPMVHALLEQTNTQISEIGAYYVCEGPGSFTGVRIGIATVKGFAQPFGTPVHAYSNMFLIACGLKHREGLIIPIIDAKRGDVYYGVYEWDGSALSTLEEGVEPLAQLLIYLEEKYQGQPKYLVGDAIESYPDAFEGSEHFSMGSPGEGVPNAHNLSISTMFHSPDASVYNIKANYMRKSQAERDV